MKSELLGMLRVFFTPSCWLQNNPYSPVWEEKFNKALAKNKFVKIDNYHAKLGDLTVWISNHPYASMSPSFVNVRPRRITILRAGDRLIEDALSTIR